MKSIHWRERVLCFFLGGLLVIAGLIVSGASHGPQTGRYQISSWTRGQFVGAMIVDTVTGRVKYVDEKNENKPFEEIK